MRHWRNALVRDAAEGIFHRPRVEYVGIVVVEPFLGFRAERRVGVAKVAAIDWVTSRMPRVACRITAFPGVGGANEHASKVSRVLGGIVGNEVRPFGTYMVPEIMVPEMEKGLGHDDLTPSHFWLPFLDTYRTMCLAPQPEFRRLLEQARDLPIAA